MNSEEKDFVNYIKEITFGYIDNIKIKDSVKNKGFERIGHGHHKNAYYNKKYPKWVVKIFNFRQSWIDDVSTIGIIPLELEPHWIKNIYVSKRFTIQPFANEKGGTRDDAVKWFKNRFRGKQYDRFDIYTNNVFYHAGNPSLVDFSVQIFPRHWYPIELRRPRLNTILNKKLPRRNLTTDNAVINSERYVSVEEMLKDVGVPDSTIMKFREKILIAEEKKRNEEKAIIKITFN